MATARLGVYCGCNQAIILLWLPSGQHFIAGAARQWFNFGCNQAMILFWMQPDHDFMMTAARQWVYSGCRQAMILLWLPPSNDFIVAAARQWFYCGCRQAMILLWLLSCQAIILLCLSLGNKLMAVNNQFHINFHQKEKKVWTPLEIIKEWILVKRCGAEAHVRKAKKYLSLG